MQLTLRKLYLSYVDQAQSDHCHDYADLGHIPRFNGHLVGPGFQ